MFCRKAGKLERFMTFQRTLTTVAVLLVAVSTFGAQPWKAKDLLPVTVKRTPKHKPVVLVKDGKPLATICGIGKGIEPARDLQTWIRATTGAELPIVRDKFVTPSIVIGDCAEARAIGLDSSTMPVEGFAIKTTADSVFIVGNRYHKFASGHRWGVNEFAERFLGMRWYFPRATPEGEEIGQSFVKRPDLVVPPAWIEDAPAFRMRTMWPPWSNSWQGKGINLMKIQGFLRSGNSWPINLKVHQPFWQNHEELIKDRPEVFQLRKDGRRQHEVICYGHPRTLETYLEGIQNSIDRKKPYYAPIHGKAITVSPADVELACYCEFCRKLWDDKGGQYGGASKVMATFVDKLARQVKTRWPDKGFTVIFLPYLNYTTAPDGFTFPGNVEVQICGMPGLASYKEPAIRDSEQANIEKWIEISGHKVQDWHYNVWPAHKTKAAYHYPHVSKDFYLRNRDKTIGTFINGDFNHWPRQHISLYCWLKVLWDPDFDVDAAMDVFCERMFGRSAKTMRELLRLQVDGWEESRWPAGRFSPKGIYETSFPPARIEKIKALFAEARKRAAGDSLVIARLDYYEPALKDFYAEADMMSGKGFRPLDAQKTGEDPVVDGKLDEDAWQRAPANSFVKATGDDKGKPAKYPTSVQALWTPNGITFGFTLTEPTPHLLETKNGGHDNGNMWWDDNVEIFVDVTAKNEGEFYQFIVNPEGDYWDSKGKDTTFECTGFKAKAAVGEDRWTLEVFLPYSAFPHANIPGSGTHTKWTGNFTRHRVADKGLKSTKPQQEGSTREYQRMNTTGSRTSDNLADFAEIKFIE